MDQHWTNFLSLPLPPLLLRPSEDEATPSPSQTLAKETWMVVVVGVVVVDRLRRWRLDEFSSMLASTCLGRLDPMT